MAYYLIFKRNIPKFKDRKKEMLMYYYLIFNAQIRNFPPLLLKFHFKLSLSILCSELTVKIDRQRNNRLEVKTLRF